MSDTVQPEPGLGPARGGAGDGRSRTQELALVRSVLSGSLEPWHQFVTTYSGLILSVIRRNLRSHDEDDLRSIYVDVLGNLRDVELATFEGRSSLASWLVVVTRSHTVDFLRKRFGRRETPRAVRDMGARAVEIFRLHYEQGCTLSEMRSRLERRGWSADGHEIVDALARIDARLDGRVLRRCESDRYARSVGVQTGRMLEYLSHMRVEAEALAGENRPDAALVAREARAQEGRLRELRERLPLEDRRVLNLRFDEGRTAQEIVQALGLNGRRKAYTIINRAIRRLRRMMTDEVV